MKIVINKFRDFILWYADIILRLILLSVVLRVFEYSYFYFFNIQSSISTLINWSINFDSLFVIIWSLYLLPLFFILHVLHQKSAIILAKSTISLFLFLLLIGTLFFIRVGTMPTQSIMEFSIEEVFHILHIEISGSSPFLLIIALAIVVINVLVLFFYKVEFHKKTSYLLLILYFIAGFVAVLNTDHLFKQFKYADSLFQFQIGNSKATYFIKSFEKNNLSEGDYSDILIANTIASYQKNRPEIDFVNSKYPLLQNDRTQNVLGPFFKSAPKPPNIVVVVTESLSSSFVGSKTTVGSLMPFTDSLIENSLYWSNLISNVERSYGVLPSILASSPSGSSAKGFIHHKSGDYPFQRSLIDILKSNGYITNYNYGGWLNFDNVERYLSQLGVGNLYGEDQMRIAKYAGNNDTDTDIYWGYRDKDLFHFSLELLKLDSSSKPKINIIQTLSIHTPFNLAPPKYYSSEFQNNRLATISNLDNDLLLKLETEVLASIFYADDALRYFINEYKKRDDFDNTIFIITGDHAINLNIDKSPFAHYRVPLIVYSNLIKRPAEFKSLHSHLDVLPSVLALLKENYKLNIPEVNSWLGQGLDTLTAFTSSNIIPLNLFSLDLPNFIVGNQVLMGDNVFNIDSNLLLGPCKNELDRIRIKKRYKEYLIVNKYVCERNKICPEN